MDDPPASGFPPDTPEAEGMVPGLLGLGRGRRVLALADAGPGGTHAAWRAAVVARDHGATLQLLAVQPQEPDASQAQERLQGLARKLQQRLRVPTEAAVLQADLREHAAELARDSGLLVLPWNGARAWLDPLRGSWPERLQRALPLPMLVVKRPALGAYRRVLVPVTLDDEAVALVAAARSISRDRHMRVLHVLDGRAGDRLRRADAPGRTHDPQRQRSLRAAYETLNKLLVQAGPQVEGTSALVSCGPVVRRTLEVARAGNTQLIVAGRRSRSVLADWLSGRVPQRLLREADADLLLLPLACSSSHASRPPLPLAA